MKITTVKYFSKRNPLSTIDSKSVLMLLFVFAASMIIGAGTAGKTDTGISAQMSDFVTKSMSLCTASGFIRVFTYSFLINLLLVLTAFLNGFNCIGLPLSVLIPSICGIGMGLIAGTMYSTGTAGIVRYCVTVLPGGVIGVTGILLACNESAYMSVDILSLVMARREINQDISLKKYIIKFILIIIVIFVASVIDSITLAGVNQLLSS